MKTQAPDYIKEISIDPNILFRIIFSEVFIFASECSLPIVIHRPSIRRPASQFTPQQTPSTPDFTHRVTNIELKNAYILAHHLDTDKLIEIVSQTYYGAKVTREDLEKNEIGIIGSSSYTTFFWLDSLKKTLEAIQKTFEAMFSDHINRQTHIAFDGTCEMSFTQDYTDLVIHVFAK